MKTIFILLFSCFFLTIKTSEANKSYIYVNKIKIKIAYEKLAKAVYLQESSGNPQAIGAKNDVGLFQITPIRLDDFNKKTGKKYSLNDRFNPIISREIFDYYAYKIGIENHEQIARRWNRANNWKDEKGKKYWMLVYNRYKKLT